MDPSDFVDKRLAITRIDLPIVAQLRKRKTMRFSKPFFSVKARPDPRMSINS